MRKGRKHLLIAAVVLFSLLGAIGASRLLYLEEQGNFHAITPGEAYRSAQLDRDELEHYIRKCGLRSVINLRGKNDGERWYQEEIAVCRRFGIKHYDLGLSADRAPAPGDVQQLLQIFQTALRPVLIHCQGGADRSGLAAALWQVVIDGRPKSEAGNQLSLIYGHMPLGPTQAMDTFFEKWGKN